MKRRIFFCSLKRIRLVEELTVDYRLARRSERVVCGCGSTKRREEINRPPLCRPNYQGL